MIGFETQRLRIEAAAVRHASLLPPFFARNRAHFAPWDPPRPAAIETTEYWERQLEQAEAEFDEVRAARFVVFERAVVAPMLIGRVNFTQIFRGPFQSCVLGYQIDHAFEGRGLMHEALGACIAFMFRDFRLHRIQAGFRPENERSARLLTRLGFQRIGIARDYLFIDHAWRDHVLMALVNPDFDDSAVAKPGR
ncbi:MAG: GNAT family N-acetyltransferase [Gemmatimonadota bacterium]